MMMLRCKTCGTELALTAQCEIPLKDDGDYDWPVGVKLVVSDRKVICRRCGYGPGATGYDYDDQADRVIEWADR